MEYRRLKLRFRRRLKTQKRQVEDISQQAEEGIEQHLLKRFSRLKKVRRFVVGWIGLFVLIIICLVLQFQSLNGYFQTLRPVSGGIYSEGIQGTVTNVNPLYATSDVDSSLSHLLFASLFTYNNQNQLIGELASSYSVDSADTTYTIQLKPHLTWQDGQPLTSADVAYTYQTIQDPDAQSPLLSSWQGITVTAPTPTTVNFTLPSPLASFPYNLTNGIVPQHILSHIAAADLRSASFNTQQPVGSGPFSWHGIQVSGSDPTNAQEQVALVPFNGYVDGKPKLAEFIVRAYASQTQLIAAFNDGQLTAVDGLDSLPNSSKKVKGVQALHLILTAGTYVFFKTSSGIFSDPKIRQAMVLASDPGQVIQQLGYETLPVREPLLIGQLGYDPTLVQQTNNLTAAQALLSQDGWLANSNGMRSKAGQPLSFTLVASDTPEYDRDTQILTQQWRKLGVDVNVVLQSSQDYSTTLEDHDYDATLYGVSIGVDPDVFVYWDSSQNDVRSTRLNLSEYDNPTADAALEAGRTRLDPALRVIKYKPFLVSWQQDAPALGLYQPSYLYVTRDTVYGLTSGAINTPDDRFNNVQNWEIRTSEVTEK